MNAISKQEARKILTKVKQISETLRNPNLIENKRRMIGGAVCNGAAAPRDLGATKHNQTKVYQMRNLVKLGLLQETSYNHSGFPYFKLTEAGEKYLAKSLSEN